MCGDEMPEKSSKGDDDKCDTKCSGWPDKMCKFLFFFFPS